MRKFVHICEEFENMWVGKDNGLIPGYINKDEKWEAEIWSFDLKGDLKDNIKGVKMVKVREFCPWLRNFAAWTKFVKRLNLYRKLIKEAKDIDVLMLFHMTKSSYWNAYFYKKFNPSGKVYVKGDFNLEIYKREMKIVHSTPKNVRDFFRRKRYSSEYSKRRKLAKSLDLLSYESKNAYEYMKDEYAGVCTKGRTVYLPNGVDDIEIKKIVKKECWNEKEDIMLVVGRLGEYAKNTEGVLAALDGRDLRGWKIYLIGRIAAEFQSKIEEFYLKNPDKKTSVVFTGPIYDRAKLGEYYKKSKVFLMPSRWESFGIAMIEALSFGNYIVTTPTSAVDDITDNRKLGRVVEGDEGLESAIEDILDGRVDLEEEYHKALEQSEKFRWSKLIEVLKERL